MTLPVSIRQEHLQDSRDNLMYDGLFSMRFAYRNDTLHHSTSEKLDKTAISSVMYGGCLQEPLEASIGAQAFDDGRESSEGRRKSCYKKE